MHRHTLLLGFLVCSNLFAGAFSNHFDDLTSVSMTYGARDTRINPAGLAYESELNGNHLHTILNMAIKPSANDDYGFGLAYGPMGFQWERLDGSLSRFGFALGVPITKNVFLGQRLALYRYSNGDSFESWDSGLQFRPLSFLSFGLMAEHWNGPTLSGAKVPAEFILGATGRISPYVDLSVDVRTLSGKDIFLHQFQSQAMMKWTPLPGFQIGLGYHTERQWQAGLTVDFDYGSAIVNGTPNSSNKAVSIGLSSTTLTQKSIFAQPTSLYIRIDSTLAEESIEANLFVSYKPSLLSILEKLRHVREAGNIKSIFIEIDSFPLGLAAAQELHEALIDLRRAGFPVEVHLGQAGLKEYLIASAAAKIHMEPEGELRFLGIKSERYYLKGILDKVGVEGQFLAKGKYKSAPEMFTRSEASPASKEATWDELERVELHVKALLGKARAITSTQWQLMQKTALYDSEQALKEKLIDAVVSWQPEKTKPETLANLTKSVTRRSLALSLPRRVAVVVAEGNILQAHAPLLALGGRIQVTPERFQKKMQRALEDPQTDAVLVRVNSPGGEVMASQQLADIVTSAKARKPVVVSMGDVAASGGYFMSAPADKIFASPLTLTGSIGVFLGKFQMAGLYQWLRLKKETLTKSPYPGLFNESRAWTPEEQKVLQHRLESYYSRFVGYVAKERHLSTEKAEAAAQGRVWLGDQAREQNLTDHLGGYQAALTYLNQACDGCGENVWEVGAQSGWLPWEGDGPFSVKPEGKWVEALGGIEPLLWAEQIQKNPYLYLSPIQKLE